MPHFIKKFHIISLLATLINNLTDLDGMTNNAHF
jgi:hypothetical protein